MRESIFLSNSRKYPNDISSWNKDIQYHIQPIKHTLSTLWIKYSKKKHNTFLFLFSNKMLVIGAGIHKILVCIANREDPDQTASSDSVCFDLFGIYCKLYCSDKHTLNTLWVATQNPFQNSLTFHWPFTDFSLTLPWPLPDFSLTFPRLLTDLSLSFHWLFPDF